ncbi:MAG: deaminase [Patescibacteria group bacterium]
MHKLIIAYIPVLHQGYFEFFKANEDANELWVLGDWLANEFKEVRKDIRKLNPKLVVRSVKAWEIFNKQRVASVEDLSDLGYEKDGKFEVIMPNDQVCKKLARRYFPNIQVNYFPIFLRWDKHNVLKKVKPRADEIISKSDFDKKVMGLALRRADRSVDWWRQVAGIIVKDDRVLLAGFNKHLPTEHESDFHNDIRSLFSKGQYFELVGTIHAEAMVIAEAAKKGTSLDGTSLYVSTFPCPICAKQIAHAGIKKLYYFSGYSLTDGVNVLKDAGVKLIRVKLSDKEKKKLEDLDEAKSILKKYE